MTTLGTGGHRLVMEVVTWHESVQNDGTFDAWQAQRN